MDFSKAFDKVDHSLLIYKLFNLGVNLKTDKIFPPKLKPVCSYRRQTIWSSTSSARCPPGLWSFLAYINDLLDSLKSRTRLFAEDTIV